jgi:hypothetical protein
MIAASVAVLAACPVGVASSEFWSDFWSAGTAIGTIGLAIATFLVVRQNMTERTTTERHHQDGFKPICIIDQERIAGRLSAISLPERQNVVIYYEISGRLKNVGVGPALKPTFILHFAKRAFDSTISNPALELLRPIVVGTEYIFVLNREANRTIDISPMTEKIGTKPNLILGHETILDIASDRFSSLLESKMDLEILVTDVFGQEYRTKYACVPVSHVTGGSFISPPNADMEFQIHRIFLSLKQAEELAHKIG